MTVTTKQKRKVRERANWCCEYCRLSETERTAKFHIDHIIPVKHSGVDGDDNLCLACLKCNSYKGANVAVLDPLTNDATKLYHPRQQLWETHFEINSDGSISGLTSEGRATVFVLRINNENRAKERAGLYKLGKYPCEKA